MNSKNTVSGIILTCDDYLYPDTEIVSAIPKTIRTYTYLNGTCSMQVLLKAKTNSPTISVESNDFDVKYYQMLKVPVEYNTASGNEQNGAMVLETQSAFCPPYATKLAPFYVYDALRLISNENLPVCDGLCALYLTFTPKTNTKSGKYLIPVTICDGKNTDKTILEITVYPLSFNTSNFTLTNWFSIEHMTKNIKDKYSEKYYDKIAQHAKIMKYSNQNVFFVTLQKSYLTSTDPYTFDFSQLRAIIEIFVKEGFKYIEVANVLSRGYLEDGVTPDSKTDTFKCGLLPNVSATSEEGVKYLNALFKELAKLFEEYGLTDNVLMHVLDEPDEHCPNDVALEKRRVQYASTVEIIKKYLPKAKIIEAIKTDYFIEHIDVLVPLSSSYQNNKEIFDNAIQTKNKEVWIYTCCVPEGFWLNRFLDQKLNHLRLIMWGISANNLSGYLHWGYNIFVNNLDPFVSTSCPNDTKLGTNFPCGDAFIVYPEKEGELPYISMRLEQQRKGVEDIYFLNLLKEKDYATYTKLISKVFKKFETYNDDSKNLHDTFEEVLKSLL